MTNKKLKIGLLVEDESLPAWAYEMVRQISESDYAEISLIIENTVEKTRPNSSVWEKIYNNKNRLGFLAIRKALEMTYHKLVDRVRSLPDAMHAKSCQTIYQDVPRIKVTPIQKLHSDYFIDEDIQKIKESQLDVIIRLGFRILRGDILMVSRYGVWSFHHGDNNLNRGGPAGYWESMQSWPETGMILQILSEDLDNGQVLSRSYSSTKPFSYIENMNHYFWKSPLLMTRKLAQLHTLGAETFFDKVQSDNKGLSFYSERLYTAPTNSELFKLTLTKVKEKIKHIIESEIYFDQWILMFDFKSKFSSSLWRYKKIIPPKDRFWADPHVMYRDNKYYIFLEEYLYSTDKGHISLLVMDEKGNYEQPEVILDTPYHLSYPFIFEHNNELFMIPESMENGTVELYKCTGFPNQWEFQMNLLENVKLLDVTLKYLDNKWWMFANCVEIDGVSSWDELYLFSSEELYSTNWQPHPQNPIVSDCKRSRPAGKIFENNGVLYRPSQNSSHKYGYGFNLNSINVLNEHEYSETLVSKVEPNWDKSINATHTFNHVNNLYVIDAQYRRRK